MRTAVSEVVHSQSAVEINSAVEVEIEILAHMKLVHPWTALTPVVRATSLIESHFVIPSLTVDNVLDECRL